MSLYNSFFYHSMYRKCVLAFGSIFSNIYVVRHDPGSSIVLGAPGVFGTGVYDPEVFTTAGPDLKVLPENSRERVPITYGPKERYVYRDRQDPNFNSPMSGKFPRMSYEVVSMNYAPERMHSVTQKLRSEKINNTISTVYQPVPYDLQVSLFCASQTAGEGYQIVEQILPFFAPDYTLTLNVMGTPAQKLDMPITMIGVTREDTWDGSFEEQRLIIWTLDFTIKTYFFGPVRGGNKIITSAELATHIPGL